MFNLSKLMRDLSSKKRRFLQDALRREQVEFNKDGFIMVAKDLMGVRGVYRTEDGMEHPNVVTSEGQLYLLSAGLAGGIAEANWYLALWANAVTPSESWTAANFSTEAGEITSTSEGYTGDRKVWTPDTPLVEPMSNTAAPAMFNIVSATSILIQGPALLSSLVRGGTAGILLSAAPFEGGSRTQYNGDAFRVVYEESLEPV